MLTLCGKTRAWINKINRHCRKKHHRDHHNAKADLKGVDRRLRVIHS